MSAKKQIRAKIFDSFDDYDWEPGSYLIREDDGSVFMTLPCGHHFHEQGKWELIDKENENKITLSPSIFCSPQVPCWHGWLRNGEFVDA